MNRSDARIIAETITNQQLVDMFESAKRGIRDWTERSAVNKSFSLGVSWNILAKDFDPEKSHHVLAKKNMIWEFGDFLPDESKPSKDKKVLPEIHHEEPVFDN